MNILGPSWHMDTFARDRLPAPELWPDFLPGPVAYPECVNVGFELCDRMVEIGFGDRVALIGQGRQRTYRQMTDWSNRLARVLCDDFGVKPGNRVMIRSGNNPAMVSCWLAVTKAGAVAVHALPDLRARELAKIVDVARIRLALCDTRMMNDLVLCAKESRYLDQVIGFDATAGFDSELDRMALLKPIRFDAVPTGRDDVALLAVNSGPGDKPKATIHFHRDLLAVADGFAKDVLGVTPNDVIVGCLPLVHTFGLGSLAICPLRFGASTVLFEHSTPRQMVKLVEQYRASITFSVPATYRAMLDAMNEGADLSSIRVAVSLGKPLSASLLAEWRARTGKPILNGVGATELTYVFISNRIDDVEPGHAGIPLMGYEACVVGEGGEALRRGERGRLAVRGPTGCRYLSDEERQRNHVRAGWNLMRETFRQDELGRFHFMERLGDCPQYDGPTIIPPFDASSGTEIASGTELDGEMA